MGGVQGNSRVMGQTHAHMDSMYIDRFFFFVEWRLCPVRGLSHIARLCCIVVIA